MNTIHFNHLEIDHEPAEFSMLEPALNNLNDKLVSFVLITSHGDILDLVCEKNSISIGSKFEERAKEKDRLFLLLSDNILPDIMYAKAMLTKFYIFYTPNAEQIHFWNMKNIPVPEPMIYIPEFRFTDPNYKVLSYEHIPCHTHFVTTNKYDSLIFEANWQMYFGETYYKYIPKPLFDALTECEENVILEHGIRRITLYKNPEDFGTPPVNERMWAFRRQLGIDSIGHELTYNLNRIEPTDLPVLITKKNCIKGTTQVTRFLDSENQLVPPSQAIKKEIKEYLDDGITVVFEEIESLALSGI